MIHQFNLLCAMFKWFNNVACWQALKKNADDAERDSNDFKRKIQELKSDVDHLKLNLEAANRAIAEKETSVKVI